MDEYKSNSHKSKEGKAEPAPEKKVEKVVTGEVISRKKGVIPRAVNILVPVAAKVEEFNDCLDNIKAVYDSVMTITDLILYGETRHNRRNTNASRVSYRNYYERGNDRRERRNENRNRGTYSYDDVILSTRGEAEEVLLRMEEMIDTYGLVSVADLYDLVGITGSYTDNNYGWTNLRSAEPIRVRNGYMLKLPRALPID